MTIDQVAEMLGVQPGLLQPFAVADPFHDGLPQHVALRAQQIQALSRGVPSQRRPEITTLVSRTASTGRAGIVNSPHSACTLLSSIRPHGLNDFSLDFRCQFLLG